MPTLYERCLQFLGIYEILPLPLLNSITKLGPGCSQRDYFRQDQDEVLSTPIEIARKLPDDILKIAGYCKNEISTIKCA